MKKSLVFTAAVASAFFLAILTGCASTKKTVPLLNKVYVTNTTPVSLLPVTAITEEIDQYQYFEGSFGEKSFSTMLSLQADSTGIQILMLNEMGIEIGSITYDGVSCIMNSSFFPKNLKAEYIILDLQNAYADAASLKEHYKTYGLDFEECQTPAAPQRRRTLSKSGKEIERVEYSDSTITITNTLRGYTYTLTAAQ